jgi:diguanylate cyclase (GGDEF)-like protein
MRAGIVASLLGVVIAIATPVRADNPGDGTDPKLEAEMQRLYDLRTSDPQTFVAQSRSLEDLAAPTNLGQRQFLQLLAANRLALEGRATEAIAAASPLAEDAEDPDLRLRAGAFVVNMQAATREFEPALRRLGALLQAVGHATDPEPRDAVLHVWDTAAIFYNQLGQHGLAAAYAKRLLEASPSGRRRCNAVVQLAIAALGEGSALDDRRFEAWHAACVEAGETSVALGYLGLSQARFLASQGRLDDSLGLIASRLGAIESTRYPRLVAEAYALDAELLLSAGRLDEAERQAREAVRLSADLPTGLPAAMAEKVLYEIARRRGDAVAALAHLQKHIEASRALAEERQIKDLAFRTVQHEALQREQALSLAEEQHRVLGLEAEVAKAESQAMVLGVTLLAITVGGLGLWSIRFFRQERHFRRISQTDALTGFVNRQHFALVAESALARHHDHAVMLVSFDLDHFKRVNDRHGHLAGDAVLRTVSRVVQQVPVPQGLQRVLGRLGGEEFALLLEGATPDAAFAHAEACRQAIARAEVRLDDGATLEVTASFGVTGTHEVSRRLRDLLVASDRMLYRAKHQGRNRVETSGSQSLRDAA